LITNWGKNAHLARKSKLGGESYREKTKLVGDLRSKVPLLREEERKVICEKGLRFSARKARPPFDFIQKDSVNGYQGGCTAPGE